LGQLTARSIIHEFSKKKNFKKLALVGPSVSNPGPVEFILQSLSETICTLSELILSNCSLDKNSVEPIVILIEGFKAPYLKTLDLSENKFG